MVTRGGTAIMTPELVALITFALNPQTVISLLEGLLVTNPAPLMASCLPPTKELIIAVALGSLGKATVTV